MRIFLSRFQALTLILTKRQSENSFILIKIFIFAFSIKKLNTHKTYNTMINRFGLNLKKLLCRRNNCSEK